MFGNDKIYFSTFVPFIINDTRCQIWHFGGGRLSTENYSLHCTRMYLLGNTRSLYSREVMLCAAVGYMRNLWRKYAVTLHDLYCTSWNSIYLRNENRCTTWMQLRDATRRVKPAPVVDYRSAAPLLSNK